MKEDELAKYLFALITGRGLTIPAVQAETYIAAKKWLWDKFHAVEPQGEEKK